MNPKSKRILGFGVAIVSLWFWILAFATTEIEDFLKNDKLVVCNSGVKYELPIFDIAPLMNISKRTSKIVQVTEGTNASEYITRHIINCLPLQNSIFKKIIKPLFLRASDSPNYQEVAIFSKFDYSVDISGHTIGLGSASKRYFYKTADELQLNEIFALLCIHELREKGVQPIRLNQIKNHYQQLLEKLLPLKQLSQEEFKQISTFPESLQISER